MGGGDEDCGPWEMQWPLQGQEQIRVMERALEMGEGGALGRIRIAEKWYGSPGAHD